MSAPRTPPPPPPPPPIRWDDRGGARLTAGAIVAGAIAIGLGALLWGGAAAGEANVRDRLASQGLTDVQVRGDMVWCLKGEFGWSWTAVRDGRPVAGQACTGGFRGTQLRQVRP